MRNVLQKFKGHIYEITHDSIRAELEDLTDSENTKELMEIPIIKFPANERQSLAVGAQFYWEIDDNEDSTLRLCDSKRWTQDQINSIMSKGKQMFESLSEPKKEGMDGWAFNEENENWTIKLGNDNIGCVTIELQSSQDRLGTWFLYFKCSESMTPEEPFYYEMINHDERTAPSLSQVKNEALNTAYSFFSYIAKCANEKLMKNREVK